MGAPRLPTNSTPMSSPSILRPEVSVPIGENPIIVRELSGLDALEFFMLLGKHAKEAIAACTAIDANGNLTIDANALLARLQELALSVSELSTFLLTKSTGDAEVLQKHGALQCLALLDAALEVNLTDDHIALAKKVGGRVGRFLSAEKSITPQPVTS